VSFQKGDLVKLVGKVFESISFKGVIVGEERLHRNIGAPNRIDVFWFGPGRKTPIGVDEIEKIEV
jgi:hypothetical protein